MMKRLLVLYVAFDFIKSKYPVAIGQISQDIVRKSHFSGFEEEDEEGVRLNYFISRPALTFLQPPRKRTKAEVMSEVIAKSKEHKV